METEEKIIEQLVKKYGCKIGVQPSIIAVRDEEEKAKLRESIINLEKAIKLAREGYVKIEDIWKLCKKHKVIFPADFVIEFNQLKKRK